MKEETQLTGPQRKALVEMLGEYGDIYRQASRQYEETRSSLQNRIIATLAGERGADKLLMEFKQLKTKADAIENHLDEIGFDVDGSGDFTLNYNAPSSWSKRVEDAVAKELGTKDAVLTRPFVLARAKLWTVASAEEVERVIEPLLKFEVRVK